MTDTTTLIPVDSTLHSRIQEYLNMKRAGVRAGTMVNYATSLRHLETWARMNGGVITQENYPAFVEWLGRNLAPGTARMRRQNIACFFKYCERCGYIKMSPDRVVPRFKPAYKNKEHRFIRREECEKMCELARGTVYEWGLLMAWHSGMSMIDVCGLQWKDVDMQHLVIKTPRTKTGIPMIVAPTAGDAMHTWLVRLYAEDHENRVCPELWARFSSSQSGTSRAFNRYIKRVRPDCCYHDLRHTMCTKLAMTHAPFALAGKITGHSNVNTFAGYVMPDVEELRKILKQAIDWEPPQ